MAVHSSPSHAPDIFMLLVAFAVAAWAHALADPFGTLTVFVALAGASVRLAINLRDWYRGR